MAKPPYDPEALPPDLRKLIPSYYRRPISNSFEKDAVTPQCQTKPVLHKSYAQVASLVSPQVVSPKSGGLKPKRRKRKNPLTVRLSEGERERIGKKAKTAGCSLNAYVRASVLGSDYQAPKDPELVCILRQYYFELYKQGINLNQIAKKLNAGFISEKEGSALMAAIVHSVSEIRNAIAQALVDGKAME